VCDTLCITADGRTLFAKNSDRPPTEIQVVERFGARPARGALETTHITIPDRGAVSAVGSRPHWMWGFEHGVNEHGVAIGNEKLWTVSDAEIAPPGLIGMDLVRLGLERGRTADQAVDVMTVLIQEHGQGGRCEEHEDERYSSSFLVADPDGGWIVETSGHTWAARPTGAGASISNRISLSTDWTRASADVPAGADFQDWRDRGAPTGLADVRLAATRPCVALGRDATPRDLVASMRHHGDRPWGAPGSDPADVSPVPERIDADWSGLSVCMHVRDYQATTASMVAEVTADPDTADRLWIALGSPCASVYVPGFVGRALPAMLGEAQTWSRFAGLRARVEGEPGALETVREVLAPLEAALWDEADELAPAPSDDAAERFAARVETALERALERLGV
jgi:hypothetical protein